MNKVLGFSLFAVILIVGFYFLTPSDNVQYQPTEENLKVVNQKDLLTFSNTQDWDDSYYEIKEMSMIIVEDAFSKIEITAPPINSSDETAKEISFLHELEAARTPEKVAEIEAEVDIGPTIFGGQSYIDIIEGRPETAKLLEGILADSLVVILQFKDSFNRVRPNKLDETITVSVPVPGHPAYPSGHATQSYILALVLSDLNPDKTEEYIADAMRIAHNREIGGLHYPSDSEAGRSLAKQYYDLLAETEMYKDQLAKAQIEW